MFYRFKFCPYQRSFKQPLQTSHGSWDVRKGIILQLTDENRVSWGEIAPLSWFGSETFEQALDFCHQLPLEITDEIIFSIPDKLPACQFGFESAREGSDRAEAGKVGGDISGSISGARNIILTPESCILPPVFFSGLLPTGEAALEQWQTLWNQGYRTFKWKIGVAAIQDELKIFHKLLQVLPADAKLRLDANGGLSIEEANEWLQECDRSIEFLEQPLGVEQLDAMLELSDRYSTQIALDESVATIDQLEAAYQKGWRDIFVIKPCIAGSPSRLRQFCRQHEIDVVFSSVFESPIGRQAALKLAVELSRHNRAVGFGTNHWFIEEDETWLRQICNNL